MQDYNYTENDVLNDQNAIIDQMFKSFGVDDQGKAVFKPAWAIDNFTTAQKIQRAIDRIGTPPNSPPATPDIFHLRIGAANFYVPPVGISVSTGFKTGSLTGGAIRQKSSPKFSSGHRETTINIRLYFPNYEEIWGITVDDGSNISVNSDFKINFKDPKDEQKVDKFLSSLRGLVAAFKYSPILPVKNHYLNSVHGITAVAMNSMNISTIADYPFALVVDLELLNFNHKVFLPMLNDFNQSIHWGKYRQYMGKVAGSMYNYINEDFILQSEVDAEAAKKVDNRLDISVPLGGGGTIGSDANNSTEQSELDGPYNFETDVLTTNPYKQWQDGKNLAIYVPAQVQSKLYTPDESTFQTPEETALTDLGRGFWNSLLNSFGVDINESESYGRSLDSVVETARNQNIPPSLKKKARTVLDVALAGSGSKDISDKVYESLAIQYIAKNNITNEDVKEYLLDPKPAEDLEVPSSVGSPEEILKLSLAKQAIYKSSKSPDGFLNAQIDNETDKLAKKRKIQFTDENKKDNQDWLNIRKEVEKEFIQAFDVSLYERFFTNADIKSILEAARDRQGSYSFREWDVPMALVDLDPSSVIINSINVTLGNNLAKFQVQMHDEPTYQHIGAKDSYVNISMTVFGEKELIKLKKTFDFLSGLARLEKAAGVIGFLGIKNIITALSGIKYVMPLSYNVDTVPNFPHVYSVQLSLVDFDVYQQKREKLSSEQQRKFIEEFKNKRNPFLRLKQNWSVFNAYPDMPLMIKDENGDVLGTLDPDFYFRSFEVFDRDIINSLVDPDQFSLPIANGVDIADLNQEGQALVNQVKEKLLQNNGSISEIKDFLIKDMNLKPATAMNIFRLAIFDKENDTPIEQEKLSNSGSVSNKYPKIWQDFIDQFIDEFGVSHTFEDLKFETRYGDLKIGDLVSGSKEQIESFNKLIKASEYNLEKGELPSIDPDEAEYVGLIHYLPSAQSGQLGKIPALLQTPDGGFVMGFSNEEDGRFYIAADNLNITRDSQGSMVVNGVSTTKVVDTSSPDRDPQNSHTGVAGAQSLDKWISPYASNKTDEMQSVSSSGSYSKVAQHWEKMMMDTQYRDISGRMIRAFPTYMLWLIDEGGYFAGVKLFDNFYGLQSVIDFSIVQSEDILGDTLILRLSNVYSKLTKPELSLTEIMGSGLVEQANSNLTYGTAALIDVLLNASRNFSNHFDSRYITEIENVRLKPGVRVHLRAGYGSNPNSLETLFNGVITSIESGEILTVTAQSDAIELSPIINSTNKKGDSGKIDGGINTGLWMSEPRDLMVRLLSMGTSRTKEAFAHATRGTVFSENKFGIRHFGSVLYEPLTDKEKKQSEDFRNSVQNASYAIGNNPVTGSSGLAFNSGVNIMTGGMMQSAGGSVRTPIIGAMGAMWSNLSTQRDIEIFKRNIYPGNGIGIAQFLGGDIDDGWSTLASVDEEKLNAGYADRLSSYSVSRLVEQAGASDSNDSSSVLDDLTAGNKLVDSSKAVGTSQVLAGALTGLVGGSGAGMIAAKGSKMLMAGRVGIKSGLGGGLLGNLGGRGTMSIFKTMGLVSDLDDDLYDEVSFRAQTYMRSVWDMFQLCARLLPNYIVAVRPFEDRSTVFYGKPHWLYTSGVVPVSTGFVNDNQARQSGITIPSYVTPDQELSDIMNTINSETSPVADSAAFASLQQSTLGGSLAAFAQDSVNFNNVFAAGQSLRGKVINFGDKNRNQYYDSGKIKSILPVNKGKTQVGFHLPFGDPKSIAAEIQTDQHKQVPYLPIRYRYPFFTNRASGTLPSLDFDKILKLNQVNATVDELSKVASNLVEIAKIEKEITTKGEKSKLVAKDQNGEYQLSFNFDFAQAMAAFNGTIDENVSAAFDPSGIVSEDSQGIAASAIVTMPLPVVDKTTNDIVKVDGQYEFTDKFKDIYGDLGFAYDIQAEYETPLDFSDWGMPATAEDEQFYIAMRWPYDPTQAFKGARSESVLDSLLKRFKSDYGLNDYDLVGTPEDYKKRKVLIYNPNTKQAVVCKPAYFLWGETDPDGSGKIEAIVSPDAALFLGMLIDEDGNILMPQENTSLALQGEGFKGAALPECRFTFVDDSVPVGVVTSSYNPASEFYSDMTEATRNGMFQTRGEAGHEWTIGFGRFSINEEYQGENPIDPSQEDRTPYVYKEDSRYSSTVNDSRVQKFFTGIKAPTYTYDDTIKLLDPEEYQKRMDKGGNYSEYFEVIRSVDRLDELKEQTLIDKRNKNENTYFQTVYDPISNISIQARGFYDEDFDREVKVLAGNGRTLKQAQDIWDQFRWGYHTYQSVKDIFQEIYGLDPDDDDPNSTNPIMKMISTNGKQNVIEEFSQTKNDYSEFNSLLGADWVSGISREAKSSLDNSIEEYIDGGFDGFNEENKIQTDTEKGLIDAYNRAIERKFSFIVDAIKQNVYLLGSTQSVNTETTTSSSSRSESNEAQGQANESDTASAAVVNSMTAEQVAIQYLSEIKTSKQLFLLLVGIFRQKLWEDSYSRAWIVLRPDRKRFVVGGDKESDAWSFRPVDKIWQAFIDYNTTYSKDPSKFKTLLKNNAKEGNSATNWMTGVSEDATNFWDKNIGPVFTVFSSAIGNLMNMFRMSMAQMGYGLSEVDNFARQANILNKAYNDSIYYSLGRPGTLLRAVDNPFTREYAEPVVEIREPFQRIHYLSSFSHIVSNQIEENLGGVATQITAVSDGKYPVTVALDKAAPAERQVEKTVETGIYFDNIRGSGFFGVLHPIFHPMQTIRGISKAASGEPDELTARRVALAHLKESIKDVYGGELMIIGNPDIRPHDLVYLADVYERMYGIFEVEQVVHHFTPEMGFTTSIKPNAFVTINDPARWFMSSWLASRFSMQNLRNDTRLLLSTSSGSNLVNSSGQISIDSLAQTLSPQMLGGIQYTHGHSALVKDVIANMTADAMPDVAGQMKQLIKNSTGKQDGSLGGALAIGIGAPIFTAATTAIGVAAAPFTGGLSLAAAGGIGFAVGAIGSDLAWSGWKWTRDNILDQHGCYVQYLNKNGQPMDAGLSFNQGMVVGKYHSKKLLPGILGVRTKVRTPDGNAYIRSDDLLKSIGWKEKEISDLVRYISLENAIVNSQILKYSGIGPEKTGLNQFFRVIGMVTNVVDGDTFDVKDILSGKTVRIRFEGINTAELASTNINAALNDSSESQSIFNPNTSGGKALLHTANAVEGKLVVLRISPSANSPILTEDDLEAGAMLNNPENYTQARTSAKWTNPDPRYMATIFHTIDASKINNIVNSVRSVFIENIVNNSVSESTVVEAFKKNVSYQSVIYNKYEEIYAAFRDLPKLKGYFNSTGSLDPLNEITIVDRKVFSALVSVAILDQVYSKASEWPLAGWDEYYNDGTPITLNWELVVNGLAKIYTRGLLLTETPAQVTIEDQIPMPERVI